MRPRLHIRSVVQSGVTLLLLLACARPSHGQEALGWQNGSIGSGRGDITLSVGAQFWKDYFRVRNLIARGTLDLAPGWRAHGSFRRREGSWQRYPLVPDLDEAYLEFQRFYVAPRGRLSLNARAGRVRYLRFPAPDWLAEFDQVPGIEDFGGGDGSDYRGLLGTADHQFSNGMGLHAAGIVWGGGAAHRGISALEWYGSFRRELFGWRAEVRAGALADRAAPLGGPARRGAGAFLGHQIGEFEVGVMGEWRRLSPTYTGISVRFRANDVTRALGTVGFDYERRPEGLAVQYDLLRVRINESIAPPSADEELVGEVRAERLRTYWQQGFQRNEYEHRLSAWGITEGPGVRAVVRESPWYLQLEALVSPHTEPNRAWFADRQGPAQLAQEVVYRFYRRRSASARAAQDTHGPARDKPALPVLLPDLGGHVVAHDQVVMPGS